VSGVAFSPDGKLMVTGNAEGTLRILALDPESLMNLAHSRLTRWFTPQECRKFLHQKACPPEP
jgi:hypothetical protein